jgi:Protein of unknown function (DUF3467)
VSEQEVPGPEFQILVPPEWEGGAYADFLSVWHSPYEFTLDFCATQHPQAADPDDPDSAPIIRCRVVARVKLPVTLAFDVIRALNDNLTRYEEPFGVVARPGDEEES